jgi:hypothetical protein
MEYFVGIFSWGWSDSSVALPVLVSFGVKIDLVSFALEVQRGERDGEYMERSRLRLRVRGQTDG